MARRKKDDSPPITGGAKKEDRALRKATMARQHTLTGAQKANYTKHLKKAAKASDARTASGQKNSYRKQSATGKRVQRSSLHSQRQLRGKHVWYDAKIRRLRIADPKRSKAIRAGLASSGNKKLTEEHKKKIGAGVKARWGDTSSGYHKKGSRSLKPIGAETAKALHAANKEAKAVTKAQKQEKANGAIADKAKSAAKEKVKSANSAAKTGGYGGGTAVNTRSAGFSMKK